MWCVCVFCLVVVFRPVMEVRAVIIPPLFPPLRSSLINTSAWRLEERNSAERLNSHYAEEVTQTGGVQTVKQILELVAQSQLNRVCC
ncbi:hypothetical protein PDJAM_G00266160 [Pangasius djambal]|nr:hypothetical protein [Pangasius djambal]